MMLFLCRQLGIHRVTANRNSYSGTRQLFYVCYLGFKCMYVSNYQDIYEHIHKCLTVYCRHKFRGYTFVFLTWYFD